MIRQLAADGKTILISSHILTELAEMCDRVGIIEQGRLLATGTVEEIQKGQTPQSEVECACSAAASGLRQWLGQRGDVPECVGRRRTGAVDPRRRTAKRRPTS